MKRLATIIVLSASVLGACGGSDPKPATKAGHVTETSSFGSCAEATAAGKAPLHRGDAGYSDRLDRDGDGVACETQAVKTPTLTVDGLDQAGCDAYAAKQTRLNAGKTWTAKLNGSTCELTSH